MQSKTRTTVWSLPTAAVHQGKFLVLEAEHRIAIPTGSEFLNLSTVSRIQHDLRDSDARHLKGRTATCFAGLITRQPLRCRSIVALFHLPGHNLNFRLICPLPRLPKNTGSSLDSELSEAQTPLRRHCQTQQKIGTLARIASTHAGPRVQTTSRQRLPVAHERRASANPPPDVVGPATTAVVTTT